MRSEGCPLFLRRRKLWTRSVKRYEMDGVNDLRDRKCREESNLEMYILCMKGKRRRFGAIPFAFGKCVHGDRTWWDWI